MRGLGTPNGLHQQGESGPHPDWKKGLQGIKETEVWVDPQIDKRALLQPNWHTPNLCDVSEMLEMIMSIKATGSIRELNVIQMPGPTRSANLVLVSCTVSKVMAKCIFLQPLTS